MRRTLWRTVRDGRQFGQHLAFFAPQQEGREQLLQCALLLAVAVALDRLHEAKLELLEWAEQSGIQEVEDAPEIPEVIFDRRSGEREPVARGQTERGASPLRMRVLDELRFVQHERVPLGWPAWRVCFRSA